jgi:hypothetical protein
MGSGYANLRVLVMFVEREQAGLVIFECDASGRCNIQATAANLEYIGGASGGLSFLWDLRFATSSWVDLTQPGSTCLLVLQEGSTRAWKGKDSLACSGQRSIKPLV